MIKQPLAQLESGVFRSFGPFLLECIIALEQLFSFLKHSYIV